MTILTEKEYELFQRLVSMTQTQLYNTLNIYLNGKYINRIEKRGR